MRPGASSIGLLPNVGRKGGAETHLSLKSEFNQGKGTARTGELREGGRVELREAGRVADSVASPEDHGVALDRSRPGALAIWKRLTIPKVNRVKSLCLLDMVRIVLVM